MKKKWHNTVYGALEFANYVNSIKQEEGGN